MTMSESNHGPTVLCVDDELGVLRALERTLHRYGCRVLSADSGPAALEVLRRERVEVMICDEAMPEMAGTELLHHVKKTSPETSRILLTGRYGDPSVMMRAVNEGEIFRLLAKPWDDEQLLQAVREALGSDPEGWRRRRRRLEERLEVFGAPVGGEMSPMQDTAAESASESHFEETR